LNKKQTMYFWKHRQSIQKKIIEREIRRVEKVLEIVNNKIKKIKNDNFK